MIKRSLVFILPLIPFLLGCAGSSQSSNEKSVGISYYSIDNTPIFVPPDTGAQSALPNDTIPSVIKKVSPDYPNLAIRAGIAGDMVIKVLVNSDGTVSKVVPWKADAEIFMPGTLDAARQWIFKPPVRHGSPQRFIAYLTFRFVSHHAGDYSAHVILPE
jgi:TonB family protein